MSVQAGIWNFDGRAIDQKLLANISDSLKHQGPDGESCHVDGSIALLYRPFHTTAESRREKQPYLSHRGFILTWDGRLDDRHALIADLRSDLEADPTDVAIVAAAFDRWETDCFRHIVGDSIWKPEQRELLFAADYMSIRHIFYYHKNDHVWWSTDLRPLVLLSGAKFSVDDDYIAGYFAHDPDAHLTPYREIREVPPGQFVRIRTDITRVERFWRFSPKSQLCYKTDAEYEEHFRHVFRQSVQRRLRSDSPILAELSGGLDSSSIVCMADDIVAHGGEKFPRLDTISYYDKTEPNGDDWIYFPKVEQQRGRVGMHIDASKIGDTGGSLECPEFQPLPGVLGIGRHLVADRTAVVQGGGYRAILSGIGGDEFLGGIPNPSAQLADLIVRCEPLELTKQLLAWSLVKRRPWIQLLWSALVDLLPSSVAQYFAEQATIESWIDRHFARRTKIALRLIDVGEHFGLWLPTRRSCIGGIILMANKMAKCMPADAQLEECRYPYLDQDLIEFILSIPASQLLRPGQRRSLMRRSLAGLVPPEILSRRTKQFGARTPMIELVKRSDQIRMAFDSPLTSTLGYVNRESFLAALRATKDGHEIHISRTLRTVSLELWLRDLASRGLLANRTDRPRHERELPAEVVA
jgi:asparagine synthase (glutamine-hydrolysing)